MQRSATGNRRREVAERNGRRLQRATIAWNAVDAAWKQRIGQRLSSEPFLAEARMTHLDGWLATAILVALALNGLFGWWWADPAAAIGVAAVAIHEAAELFTERRARSAPSHAERHRP